jgi:glycosyltransferase involved in cell wall biosynthesis
LERIVDLIPFALALLVLCFVVVFWLIRARDLIQTWRQDPDLRPNRKIGLPVKLPLISVIVPAHNEETAIAECLESVLEQDYPCLELICVDDRSVDRTATIARSVCAHHANCTVISVAELPAGWTGKCHALDVAVKQASGEWLAFLDADSRLWSGALSQCYHEALRRGVSMVTLSPKFVLETFWEKALQPAFAAMSCILFPPSKINDPQSDVASANGMFYLINRAAYERIGGHRDVKCLAVEDIGIGKRVKASGLGLLFANGRHVLRTRMYTNFHDITDGWTRILSASMNYRLSTVLKYLVVHILMSMPVLILALSYYMPTAVELWPGTWFLLPVACIVLMTIIPYFYCTQLGVSPSCAVLLSIGQLMLIWVFSVIVKKIVCKDALQWRGTTYSTSLYQPTKLNPVRTVIYETTSSPPME